MSSSYYEGRNPNPNPNPGYGFGFVLGRFQYCSKGFQSTVLEDFLMKERRMQEEAYYNFHKQLIEFIHKDAEKLYASGKNLLERLQQNLDGFEKFAERFVGMAQTTSTVVTVIGIGVTIVLVYDICWMWYDIFKIISRNARHGSSSSGNNNNNNSRGGNKKDDHHH